MIEFKRKVGVKMITTALVDWFVLYLLSLCVLLLLSFESSELCFELSKKRKEKSVYCIYEFNSACVILQFVPLSILIMLVEECHVVLPSLPNCLGYDPYDNLCLWC